ncbi:MAG: hypothetical protein B7Y74_04055 [Novosphingobium sp. 35-62-5]|nr:MAG: hypothetical protein B7Y74_04055 [Novosphingobium sp. 35-62-5]
MEAVHNYRLLRAATQIDATAGARLLLVHLIGYLGVDDTSRPEQRFVVFPGNTRLSDELRCTTRSIQRQADELEAKGFLRRCYNGLNHRTGFDLTPFAMQHEEVIAGVVAVHTRRRQERDLAQLELSLEADRITRPVNLAATSVSSQGDAGVARNRSPHNKLDGTSSVLDALDSFDTSTAASVAFGGSDSQDRTEYSQDAILAHITSTFTGNGRTSHLGWASALQSLGRERAVALYLIAERDPRRRQSPERYFGWLLRTVTDKASSAISEAARRASRAVQSRADERASCVAAPGIQAAEAESPPLLASAMPDAAVAPGQISETTAPTDSSSQGAEVDEAFQSALRRAIGEQVYASWLAGADIRLAGNTVRIKARSPFAASWIEGNLLEKIGHVVSARYSAAAAVKIVG